MSVQYSPQTAVDFVVIGAGAAGGIVAKELSTAGFSVVVLEQGPYLRESEFTHDEVKNVGQWAMCNDMKTQPNTFRARETEAAKPMRGVLYGRGVGGGTVHFTANYWRFREVDFDERSRLGPISGTGFDDWPISYADLEPYYTKAEWDLGVSGQAGVPGDSFRSKPYPLPPLPNKSSGVLFERAARKLGWHPVPAPMAILSKPYRGRNACMHCGWCELFGCEFGAKSSTLSTVIPMAEKTGRCEIRPNSYVRRISTDKAGRVDGVVYFDGQRREIRQRARAVVLCANGAETPRLLLISASNQFPNGLANSSGLVGKYLMFTGGTFAGGLFEHPLNEYKSVQVTRIALDFYDSDPKRGFYGGGGLDGRFNFYPAMFALFGLPPGAPAWGAEYKRLLKQYFTRTMYVMTHTTSLPLASNSITLDPELKDAWGLPAMRVTYTYHRDDMKTQQFFDDRARDLLVAAGAKKVWSYPIEESPSGFPHLLGTCRMGNDPRTSVVDKYHRAHDVRNLFIVDGSSFVTSGRGQPTCTIQALAYRAADHVIRFARKGEI